MLDLKHLQNARILIAALDWGFGHTTRTCVLIKLLLKENNAITFAGNKQQIDFITAEFPTIQSAYLNGYNTSLNSESNTYFQLIKQLPKLWRAMKKEGDWLKNKLNKNAFDFIISDNRYGFRNSKVPSILLTHQTNLQLPFLKKTVNSLLKRQINQFSACWIPDFRDHQLSGQLSKANLKIPTHFIGPLSRFKITTNDVYQYDYLFLISGPSPEKERFFAKTMEFIGENKLKAAVAIPDRKMIGHAKDGTPIFAQLNTLELESLINNSKTIVSKSGYTTIMDFISSKKSTILLPTKRQFEQEYLSSYHKLNYSLISHSEADFTELV